MGEAARRPRYSFAEYLELEEASNIKHEFLGGEIYAMAGGSPDHASLAAAVTATLLFQLRGKPCRVFSSDLRVRVLATGLATYPDVTVVYGPLERDPESEVTVLNPVVLVEVLSKRTEAYDRGEKFEHYRHIPSLKEYVLVAQDEPTIELWQRSLEQKWTQKVTRAGETALLGSIGCELIVRDIYRDALKDT